MGELGIDFGLGLVALVIWLAAAPLIFRAVRGMAQGAAAGRRVLVGELLMLLHLGLLVLALVGLVYAGWDVM